ncbi:MAG: nitrate/nitrite transporter [Cyclobacteriaceae bacterium]
MSSVKRSIVLIIIVTAQFCGTSLWFAGNAVLPYIQTQFNLQQTALGDLTSAVQLGFITGTLLFAILAISDRFSPSKVFFACSLAGAVFNLAMLYAEDFSTMLLLRALTGFCLAGIYPVGMKISSDYFEKGLGRALGYLVGALVIGTSIPHLINYVSDSLDWQAVIISTSILAATGGVSVYLFVPDGPFRKTGAAIELSAFFKVFQNKPYRQAAFGYFGHMWELYTLWAFFPVVIQFYNSTNHTEIQTSLWSFICIAAGGIACVIGGLFSERVGSAKTAFVALFVSGACCLVSFYSFEFSPAVFIAFMMIWGMAVVTDSPQFSTLVAQKAPPEITGTALTIVNSIGFAITIVSLQVMNYLIVELDFRWVFVPFAIGPMIGLISFFRLAFTR